MKARKIAKTFAVLLVSAAMMPLAAFATGPSGNLGDLSGSDNIGLTDEIAQFIEENEIDENIVEELGVSEIDSLIRQAEANDFSKENIQNYVGALVDALDNEEPEGLEGIVSDDGKTVTYEDGSVLPNLFSRYNLAPGQQLQEEPRRVGTRAFTNNYTNVVDSSDQSGVYWAVKSETGYTEATAFITLPTITNYSSNDRPYMFFAANSFAQGNSLTFVGDYGVVYYDGYWKPFITAKQWNNAQQQYVDIVNTPYPNVNLGSSATTYYLHILVTNGASTDKVKLRILDSTVSTVLFQQEVTFSGNPVQANAANLNIYHETTMAQHHSATSNLNANTGTKMSNAIFSSAYLYNANTSAIWGTSRTNKAYRQAPTNNKLNCVTVNSHTKWSTDDITIWFNKT